MADTNYPAEYDTRSESQRADALPPTFGHDDPEVIRLMKVRDEVHEQSKVIATRFQKFDEWRCGFFADLEKISTDIVEIDRSFWLTCLLPVRGLHRMTSSNSAVRTCRNNWNATIWPDRCSPILGNRLNSKARKGTADIPRPARTLMQSSPRSAWHTSFRSAVNQDWSRHHELTESQAVADRSGT